MPRQFQGLPIRLTNGIDTKSDRLVNQRMAVLENAVFDSPGAIRKRYGYARTSVPVAGNLALYRDELNILGDQAVRSRRFDLLLPTTPNRGVVSYLRPSEAPIWAPSITGIGALAAADIAIANGIALYTWSGSSDISSIDTRVSLVDVTTGAEFLSGVAIPLITYGPLTAVVAMANGTIRLYTGGGSLATKSWYFDFSTTNPPTSLPTPVASLAFVGLLRSLGAIADAAGTTTVANFDQGLTAYARNDGSAPTTSGGLAVTSASWVVGDAPSLQSVTIDPATGNRWVITGGSANGANDAKFYVYAFSSAATPTLVLAPTLIEAVTGYVPMSVAITVIAGRVHLFYGVISSNSSSNGYIKQTRYRAMTTAAAFVAAASQLSPHCYPVSAPFNYNGIAALWLCYSSSPDSTLPPQGVAYANTLFLATIDTSFVVRLQARAMYESAYDYIGGRANVSSVATFPDGSLNIVHAKQYGNISSVITGVPTRVALKPLLGVQAQQFGNALVVNGGLPFEYDGTQVVDQNFAHAPTVTLVSTASTGGGLTDGTYGVQVIYTWTNARGEVELSRPSDPLTVVLNAGTSTQLYVISIRAPALSSRPAGSVRYNIALTGVNGSVYYTVNDVNLVPASNGFAAYTIAYSGSAPNPQIYTASASRNDPLPFSNFLVRAGDRLWGHPGDGVLWYSKKRNTARGVEFSALQTYQLSSFTDPVAMGELAGRRYVVFSLTKTAAFSDNGVDPSGNPQFSDDELLDGSIGCVDPRSLCKIPQGVIFKSARGWYVLADSLQIAYIGSDVEAYNSYDVAGVTMETSNNRAKVALRGAGAPVLVFDTLQQNWSVEVNLNTPSPADIATWRGNVQLLDAGGYLHEQIPGRFTDGTLPIILRQRTGWITPTGLQGFMRVTDILLQGQYKSPHELYVALRYDYNETVSETYVFDTASLATTADYQWRVPLKRQLCKAISIEIYDDYTSYAAGEGYSLDEIHLILASEDRSTPLGNAGAPKRSF